jgi:glutamyl-tRNA synthetase
LDVSAVKGELDALGVPADKAEAFWNVARDNITTRRDIPKWWDLCANGAEPMVADEDAEFIADAMALLPEGPLGPDAWSNWTSAVKEVTGRKGKGLFMPLRKALTGQERGPEMADLLPLLQTIPARKLAKT